jgi:hypothetical protein
MWRDARQEASRALAGGPSGRTYRRMEARVKAGIWVSMALRLADLAGRSGVVLRRGDGDSGGILCVLHGREGLVVLTQVRDAEARPAWLRGTGVAPVDQAAADAYVDRQLKYDPDLWVLEFETPDLEPPFECRIL